MLRSDWADLEWVQATVRGRLSEAVTRPLPARGRELTLQQAVARALGDAPATA